MNAAPSARQKIVLRGVAAGGAGAVLLGAGLAAANVRPFTPGGWFEFGALYIAAAFGWGIGYASVAATRPQMDRNPVISGVAFGAVVYIVTQLVLYGAAAEQTHTAQQVVFGLAATCLLFGLPVAFVVRAFGKAEP